MDASSQVSVHLAERFQRRRIKCEKLTDDRRQTQSGIFGLHSVEFEPTSLVHYSTDSLGMPKDHLALSAKFTI
jgi:hypothetical protein